MKLTRRLRKIFLAILIGAVLILAAAGYFFYRNKNVRELEKAKKELPTATLEVPKTSPSPEEKQSQTQTPIPEKVNWDVPFTPQAPSANWDYTHEEACEEAAILMAKRFFYGQGISGADDAEKGIQDIISWEKEHLGFFESTTAEESARVIREMFDLKTEIISNPSVKQIKQALAERKLVIVPCAGRQIGNPFYKSPGPLYHFLLLKGYTQDQFITNDAGTKRGANYPYRFKTVLDANHDWNNGQVDSGAKKIIVVSK